MTITTQLTRQEFAKVSLLTYYSRTATKVLLGIVIFFIVLLVFSAGFYPQGVEWSNFIFPVIILVVYPLSVYLTAGKTFDTNRQVRERTAYHFEDSGLRIEGESYTSQLHWNEIVKVTQRKEWLLVWQNRNKAYPVSLQNMWGGQIAELKDLLEAHGVKNNLTYGI